MDVVQSNAISKLSINDCKTFKVANLVKDGFQCLAPPVDEFKLSMIKIYSPDQRIIKKKDTAYCLFISKGEK